MDRLDVLITPYCHLQCIDRQQAIILFVFVRLGDARRPQYDSHNRLFGDSDRPYTAAKNRAARSNIPIGGDEADSSLKHSNGNGLTNSSREHIIGFENGKSKRFLIQ